MVMGLPGMAAEGEMRVTLGAAAKVGGARIPAARKIKHAAVRIELGRRIDGLVAEYPGC